MSNKEDIDLPLVNFISDLNLFNQKEEFNLPEYIKDNLKHNLRDYQCRAIENLDWSQKNKDKNGKEYNHLLFNMATGSGKTDVMAALILYMYREYNYKNFLFVVNSNNIIEKTKSNLLKPYSSKYLFTKDINIDGEKIYIKNVKRFPNNPESGVIYIRLSTVQTLTQEINTPGENEITINDFNKNNKTVILADEAHHLSANTKNDGEKNKDLGKSWEEILNKILVSNSKNRQFEFTATLDLSNPEIYKKYKYKVIYKYDLSDFIKDGFSKRIYKLQANNSNKTKMLNAVLLSQYRKHFAESIGINHFKPIIMFKSTTIKESNSAYNEFLNMIKDLNVKSLTLFLKKYVDDIHSPILNMAYEYWMKKDPSESIVELQNAFNKLKLINVNDNSKGIMANRKNFDNLNTLEDESNPFRVIFAVAKLSEGWDVLNLYDIVRIGEKNKSIKNTNAEAQLIGRGARYYPLDMNGRKEFKRRFKNNSKKSMLLESIYYHTINDSKYLDNLKESFKKIHLPVDNELNEPPMVAKVKKVFKDSKTYKNGNIYYNELENVPEYEYSSLKSYGINTNKMARVNMVDSIWEKYYKDNTDENNKSETKDMYLFTIGKEQNILQKAMSRNKFYRFNSMKQYLPTLNSLKEFMTSDNWLGNIELYATVSKSCKSLNIYEKLHALDIYLTNLQRKITTNYKRKRGTNKFIPVPIKEIIKDYSRINTSSFSDIKSEYIYESSMNNNPWFVFDKSIADDLEHEMINVIQPLLDDLSKQYKNVYLLRIDEQNANFKLHQFNMDIQNYKGFMPDFILYVDDDKYLYQLFLEPKGEPYINKDKWKQELLKNIKPENIYVKSNNKVKIYGIRFYEKDDKYNIKKDIKRVINRK